MHDDEREPVRTCVGCRRRAPARELVRLRHGGDRLEIGPGTGRGAWLCAPPAGLACLDDAAKRGALARALRTEVSGDDVADLRARLDGRSGA
jgi:predicted RNA-binding protein YlxR (DUF448 family)